MSDCPPGCRVNFNIAKEYVMATETNTATHSLHRFRHGKQNTNLTNKTFSKGGFCFNLHLNTAGEKLCLPVFVEIHAD